MLLNKNKNHSSKEENDLVYSVWYLKMSYCSRELSYQLDSSTLGALFRFSFRQKPLSL
jgi:hypothetical protein